MPECYIQSFKTCFLDPENEKEALAPYTEGLPRRAARRMSTLGILLNAVLKGVPLDTDTTLVYGTTFTEAKALEAFLESMPYASPTAFQTSIHPGGVEQALIMNRQPVGAFFPLAGRDALVMQMLKAAFTASTPTTVICGGEEKGGWLRDFAVAHPVSFAFSLVLTNEPDGSAAKLHWDVDADGPTNSVTLEQFARCLASKKALSFGDPDHGQFKIIPS